MKDETHGPISEEYREKMQFLAHRLDEVFNGTAKGNARKVAFVLLTANFGQIDGGRVNYMSNGKRADIVAMLKELVGQFEGRVDAESEVRQ